MFCVTVEGIFNLRVEDIWPDGDAPDNPRAADVAAVLESCGTKERVLREWELSPNLVVTITGEHGDEPAEAWAQG